MTTGNDESFAALRQQVLGLEDDYRELKSVVVSLDRKFEAGLQSIHTKLDDKNKTPWTIIISGLGVLLAFCTTIGAMAYVPLKNEMESLKVESLRRDENIALQQRRDVEQLVLRDQRIWDAMMTIQKEQWLSEGRRLGKEGR